MQQERLAFLFNKYINHQYTAAEYQELMKLIDRADDEVLQQLLDRAYTGKADHLLPSLAVDRILQDVLGHAPTPRRIKPWQWISGVAATLLLTTALYFGLPKKTLPQPAITQNMAETIQSFNDHRMIRLADGSKVTLNKNSSLSYTKDFNGQLREVTLRGQGYFDIKHDPSKPFLVHAGNLTITVLGTAFDVDTRNLIAVTVTRGKVSVSDQHHLLAAITPNQQFNYNQQNRHPQKVAVNASQIVKWQASDLFFDNITMRDAAVILESRFNKTIKFEHEESKKCTFSASFTHGQNLQQIIKVICTFNNASYQEDGDTITIKGTGC